MYSENKGLSFLGIIQSMDAVSWNGSWPSSLVTGRKRFAEQRVKPATERSGDGRPTRVLIFCELLGLAVAEAVPEFVSDKS